MTEEGKKRKREKVGRILQIQLKDGTFAFAQILNTYYVFFDFNPKVPALSLKEIVSQPIAFKVCMDKTWYREDNWQIIGDLPLSPDLKDEMVFYKEDPLNGKYSKYFVDYTKGKYNSWEEPSTKEECKKLGLQRLSIYSACHIEKRLEKYFQGLPNPWERD